MRYFSLFTGVGGFEIGIERAYGSENAGTVQEGAEREDLRHGGNFPDSRGGEEEFRHGRPVCVGFSEIDKHASAVLKYRFPNVKNYGNIQEIDWKSVPDFDLLVGGSPCQDFSIAGKRAGLAGERSGLFHEYLRALEEKKPKYFVWENVKGVLSSRGGWDFANILSALAEKGYSLRWEVLNAKDYGVPQNRERVFVVGVRADGEGAWEILPFREDDGVRPESRKAKEEVYDVASTQTARQYASWGGNHVLEEMTKGQPEAFRVYNPDGIGKTLNAHGGGTGAKTGLIPSGARVRRLMPVECERLMSWPDGWTKFAAKEDGTIYEQSDSQRYKQAGNGVVSNCVQAIMEELIIR